MLALVSCYDHPESNNSVCIFCRHNSKDLETVCTRRGMACFTEYRNALPYIYIYLQYLQLFHVPYLMQGHCHGLGWVSSGVLYLVVIHFLARLKYFLIQCHGSCTNIYIVKSKNGNWYAVLQTLQQLLPRKEMQLCACKVINVYFVAAKWWWFSVPTYLLI